jgi:D-tyrosyl-tRNA(Tyr) deacylase
VRAVVQRVSRAAVRVEARTVGEIGAGLLVFLSVAVDDDENDARSMADKVAGLRIFADEYGLMNRSVIDARGSVLLVSQFTLHGDVRRGRRPSFIDAAKEPASRRLYELAGTLIQQAGVPVSYGIFGAQMEVELVNAGPVTILVDTKRAF